jgi:hypothetical protein
MASSAALTTAEKLLLGYSGTEFLCRHQWGCDAQSRGRGRIGRLCVRKVEPERAASICGFELQATAKLLRQCPQKRLTLTPPVGPPMTFETSAIVLDGKTQSPVAPFQADANGAPAAIGKCVLEGVCDKLGNDQTQRDRMSKQQGTADRDAFN